MRIYEFSKEKNIPSKDIIDLLVKEGFVVKNHMSALNNAALTFLQNYFKKVESKSEEKKPESTQQSSIGAHTVMQKQDSSQQRKRPVIRQTPDPRRSAPFAARVETPKQVIAPTEIVVAPMTVAKAAEALGKSVTEVIVQLLKWGSVSTINQRLDENMIQRLADYYGLKRAVPADLKKERPSQIKEIDESLLKTRLPIVVVLGHVDHGKTTLLDYVRKTRVASREKGGITQHLGAYEASTPQGNIIFLDTPGHEAFPKIRQRGVRVADLAVLIVAADDGVMPQTLEALRVIKEMKVPIIVAVNKMDKADPVRVDVIKQQLSQYDVLPEEWGGDVVYVPISAKSGLGVDKLLEMILLQTQLLELRANLTQSAKGFVLESKIEKGRGPVATVIAQHGTLKMGDHFVCGDTAGRVTALFNSQGERIETAPPSVPVQIAGFEEVPHVGDFFEVVSKEDYKKARQMDGTKGRVVSRMSQEGAINLILKADNNSSREAAVEAIEKMSKKINVPFSFIMSGVGGINESDIELAFNTGAQIVGLHVRPESNAQALAQRRNVTIILHDIIYKLLEDLEVRAESTKAIEMVKVKIGSAEVLRVFDIKGVGVIAGCMVKEGRFTRPSLAVVWRGPQKIGEGKITSLQREKRSVKEVHAGYDCGFTVDGVKDFQEGDRIDCFIEEPKK